MYTILTNKQWLREFEKELQNSSIDKHNHPCMGHGVLYQQEYNRVLNEFKLIAYISE